MTAMSTVLVAALVPVAIVQKQDEEKFAKEVQTARDRAIAFLKKERNAEGNWEDSNVLLLQDLKGGRTGLVTLALLEAGVPSDDPLIEKAVDYLAKLTSKKTYVVSLQTRVLARVDSKKYARVIERNIDWLMETAVREGKELKGWSYPGDRLQARADGSNSHFAVMAFHAAASAGAKIDGKVWGEIRDLYLRTQTPDGWSYVSESDLALSHSRSMTICALCALSVTSKHSKEDMPQMAKAMRMGWDAILFEKARGSKSEGYLLFATAELGRITGIAVFRGEKRKLDWYREGAGRLLKDQSGDGSWTLGNGVDREKAICTAFALYFLGPPPRL